MKPSLRLPFLAALVTLLPLAAAAHPGHSNEPAAGAGFLHPFTGADHLLAMIAVGLWAAQLGGRARWALPAAFLGLVCAGVALGALGLRLPGAGSLALAAMTLAGLVLIWAARWPVAAGITLAAAFAFCHGLAHGQALPPALDVWGYVLGFAAGTAGLLRGGMALGRLAQRAHPRPVGLRS
ncbi:MAG: HupE/UreJ family protein [Limisphaerales bacterium]